jgi:hypothetical protein
MKLPLANLGAVVAKWMDEELVPKATGWQKVVTVMAGVGIANNAADRVKQFLPAMVMLGFADNDGNIDIEALHFAAKHAFEKTGKIALPGGIIVGEDDVESIIAIARKFASDNTPKD